ncbi:uncharacterized protein H6S33_011795 [Morchella sextelata]|uniref:uncharacterized protein n=1 Tax=Morchella sextelata TaxID=1174677 RepID=UPI001D03C301|nr:uncharacterized protein H6S33_011795 [Morchella sextelata]KAH0610268.1 hypothetical protein H6S33_011795 [Morchella sextelata]
MAPLRTREEVRTHRPDRPLSPPPRPPCVRGKENMADAAEEDDIRGVDQHQHQHQHQNQKHIIRSYHHHHHHYRLSH